MLVKVFLETAGNFDERELLCRFYQGIASQIESTESIVPDHGTFLDIGPEYSSCDVAVMMGSWKGRDNNHHIARSSIAKLAPCFIVVETPLLGRVMFQKNKQFRVGVNGFLNKAGMFNSRSRPPDRLEALGIEWSEWKNNPDGHITVMLQLPGDASLRGISIYDWGYHVINKLRNYTDRKIILRSHPGHNVKDTDEFYKFVTDVLIHYTDVEVHIGRETVLDKSLEDCYCTVTYSSGAGIDSILKGIPTIATDPGNFAWDVSSNYLSEVEDLKLNDAETINQWLSNLAYHQWSIDEMEDGTVWKHLAPIISTVHMKARELKKRK